MKQTKRCSKWLLAMLIIALVFSNVKVALASEVTESELSDDVVDSTRNNTIVDADTADTSSTTPDVDDASDNSVSSEPTTDEEVEDTSDVDDEHMHDWSEDWEYNETYHWHECNAEDCPVVLNSQKYGYGEHDYGENGICECGYIASSEDETDKSETAEESGKKEEFEETEETEKKEEFEEVQDEPTIPPGVWSDREPFFTDDVPAEAESQTFRMARTTVPTQQEAYDLIIALKDKYPEGMTWTNFEPYGSNGEYGEYYQFQGGAVKGASLGVGCMAFAFRCSDEAFGSLPARTIDKGGFKYEDIKVGDILRVNNNSHSVIVLKVSTGGVIVAEANYNKSVHWGRAISKDSIMEADFLVTRYPVGYSENEDVDEIAHSGTEGSLNWTLTNGGVLTISGTGDMPNYTIDNGPSWNDYIGNINTVIIENGVTSIGNYAFYGSNALTVYIPEGVKSIGTGAFQSSNLVEVTIPSTTKNVSDDAFRSCENLISASISNGVETIGDNAFRACRALTYLDFPASITSVGAAAFMSCDAIVQIRFAPGTGNVIIGDSAFSQCQQLKKVTLPQGLTKISNFMFQSCTSLQEIYISANVTDIGENPFTSTRIQNGGTIQFGGSETTWKSIGGQFIINAMPNANIEYDVEFDDPFAIDPNDPGDFKPVDSDESSDTNTGTETTTPNDSDNVDNSSSNNLGTNTDTNTGIETTTPNDSDNADNSSSNNLGTNTNTNTGIEIMTSNDLDDSDNNTSSTSLNDLIPDPIIEPSVNDLSELDEPDESVDSLVASSTSDRNTASSVSDQDEKATDANVDANVDIDVSNTNVSTSVDTTVSSMDDFSNITEDTELQDDTNESEKSDSTVMIVIAIVVLAVFAVILFPKVLKKKDEDSSLNK